MNHKTIAIFAALSLIGAIQFNDLANHLDAHHNSWAIFAAIACGTCALMAVRLTVASAARRMLGQKD